MNDEAKFVGRSRTTPSRGMRLIELFVCYSLATVLAVTLPSGHDPNSGFIACTVFLLVSGLLMLVPSNLTRFVAFTVFLLAVAGLWHSKLDAERRVQKYRSQLYENLRSRDPK